MPVVHWFQNFGSVTLAYLRLCRQNSSNQHNYDLVFKKSLLDYENGSARVVHPIYESPLKARRPLWGRLAFI